MNEKNTLTARLLLPLAAAGCAALFALNFALTAAALILISAGTLCLPVGALYCLGVISVVSDLSAPALTAAGGLCLSAGALLCCAVYRFAPFCAELFDRYRFAFKGEKWRKVSFPKKHRRFLRISALCAGICAALTVGFQFIAARSGFEGTAVRETLYFDNAKYLTIDTAGLDYRLRFYDGDKIKVEYVNDSKMIVNQSDVNYLKLVQDDSFTLSLFARDQFGYEMTVWLPENDYREFYLSSGTGDIIIWETQSEYTEIHTRSGNITITEATGKISAASSEGDIFCGYREFVNSGTFSTESGDIVVEMPDRSGVKLDFNTESGWVESELTGIEGRLYGGLEAEKEAPLSRSLYVTAAKGGFRLVFV